MGLATTHPWVRIRRMARMHNIDRFVAKLEVDENGCWLWQGALTKQDRPGGGGYPRFKQGQKTVLAHRLSYQEWVGPLVEGMEIDHSCNVRSCVNPDHLIQVTPRQNASRVVRPNSLKTHCPEGHQYTIDNTYIRENPRTGGTFRTCRECALSKNRKRRKVA